MDMERELFVCTCGDVQHQLVISYFDDEPELFVSIHLCKHGFLSRLLIGLQYIFGRQSIYGAFEETVLEEKDVISLNELLTQRIEFFNKAKK